MALFSEFREGGFPFFNVLKKKTPLSIKHVLAQKKLRNEFKMNSLRSFFMYRRL